MSTFDVSTTHHAAARRRAPLLRLQVLLRRRRLDQRLARGEDPAGDAQLAIRAAQLLRPSERRRLAATLRSSVASLDDSALAQYLQPEAPLATAAVRACLEDITELARALTAPQANVRGVAIVRTLLTDGTGPLYRGGRPGDLRAVVRDARTAI